MEINLKNNPSKLEACANVIVYNYRYKNKKDLYIYDLKKLN